MVGCASTPHARMICVPSGHRSQKRKSDTPGLELLAGHPVELGCPSQALCRKTINALKY